MPATAAEGAPSDDQHGPDRPGSHGAGTGARVTDLRVALTGSGIDVVDDIDLVLEPGEIVGLVGESGSGKTTVGTALLAYSRAGARITQGAVDIDGHDLLRLDLGAVRAMRGRRVAYVPQDPGAALNPAIRIGRQMVELLELAKEGSAADRLARARAGLAEVGLPGDEEFLARYPHQLSGGQVQRVALAMAFLPRPKVLVLDEPTTGLDVTTQNLVLRTVKDLCAAHDVAALYVTHDLAVVANLADRVAVMYAGRIAEIGPREEIFARPAHPYTRALLDAIPHLSSARALAGIPGSTPGPGRRPQGCRFHDRCAYATDECARVDPPPETVGPAHVVRCLHHAELPPWSIDTGDIADTAPSAQRDVVLRVEHLDVFYGRTQVVFDVNVDLARAEVLAFVGESGSGKTTTARAIGGLSRQWTGRVELGGHELARGARGRSAADRKRIQYIFQNPYLSLNPRLTIEQIVTRPMELFGIAKGKAATDRAVELLDAVALGPTVLTYRTNRLSGGERQRVAIARALAAEPDVLVCDEITSALDVSVQGSIVALLDRLKRERGISMLFVTHNLALVRSIADRVQVLQRGRVVEQGFVVEVMENPQEDYTKTLLANTPTLR
ncbi:ABC transporter ATP-binding protein [Agilicoccus flavus]|uniref:ABC transporter ATP-binding protein n=1 Tax=Agilicoccus flavus TaxID=2775968 RepID=UPI001CF6669F|nr:ABC transporter ATP-binding protein [Agilicoccus flavus]